jgi:hypothetical protein
MAMASVAGIIVSYYKVHLLGGEGKGVKDLTLADLLSLRQIWPNEYVPQSACNALWRCSEDW